MFDNDWTCIYCGRNWDSNVESCWCAESELIEETWETDAGVRYAVTYPHAQNPIALGVQSNRSRRDDTLIITRYLSDAEAAAFNAPYKWQRW